MIVVMKKTTLGSNNGIDAIEFSEGKSYKVPSEMSKFLVQGFLQRGLCEIKQPAKLETKIIEPKEVKRQQKKLRTKK